MSAVLFTVHAEQADIGEKNWATQPEKKSLQKNGKNENDARTEFGKNNEGYGYGTEM